MSENIHHGSGATGHPAAIGEPLDFVGACLYLWRRKWLIIIVSIASGLGGAAAAWLSTTWYRSEVVMVPADRESSLSGALGQLGGLASLAGLNLGSDDSDVFLARLRSRAFARGFIEARNLLPVLFAERWDEAAETWRDPRPSRQPDLREAVQYFTEKVSTISEDGRTGAVTISIQWKDPQLAAQWANEMASEINAQLRARALEDAEHNVEFLEEEMSTATIVSLQQAMGRVLESEMQKLMMARGTMEYAFRIVDEAVPARKPFRPQRGLLVIMSALAGGLAMSAAMLVLRTVRRELARRPSGR